MSLGLGEDSLNASSALVMPMVSSKMTGFRGNAFDRPFSLRNPVMDVNGTKILETSSLLDQNNR